jgi:SAM-dependent methyltransferase
VNSLVTGSAYVKALTAADDDRVCRAAFLDLALRLGPPRAVVLDFGCGPGLDAHVYAEHGWRVYAFDVDASMCAYVRDTCARDIEAQRIRLVECSYPEFLDSAAGQFPSMDLITANFAPLNLVPEPATLFRRFAALLRPAGLVLASILNPLHRGDMRYPWWWRGLPQLLTQGQYSVPGSQAPITRWLPGRLVHEAGAAFALDAIHAPSAHGPVAARRVDSASPPDWPAIAAARYLFLTLRRTELA